VWAGNFLACWGSNNLDEQETAAAVKEGLVGVDSNVNRHQIAV